MFQKGHIKTGGKVKGTKNYATLAKEERRAVFDEEVSKIFLEKIKQAPAAYLLDQFLGKAADIVEATIKNLPTEKTKRIQEILKKLDGTK